MVDVVLKSKIENLMNKRNFKVALSLCVPHCKKNPSDAEAHFLMGSIYGQLGDFKASEDALMIAFPSASNHPALNYNLGIALYRQNKFKEAVEYLARAAQLDATQFDVWLFLGHACDAVGAKENAITAYERAVTIRPEAEGAVNKLGELYFELGRWAQAVEAYERLFDMRPDEIDITNKFCTALCYAYQYERLITVFEPVANSKPKNISANYYVAQAYFEQAEIVTAEKYFNRVLEAQPGHVESLIALASINSIKGKHDKALKLISPLVVSHPDMPGVALTFSLIGPRFDREYDAIRLLKKNLDNTKLSTLVRGKLAITLGRIYEKRGEYEKAFKLIKQGNDLYSPVFDSSNYLQSIDILKSVYSEDSIKTMAVSQTVTSKPIFIVGIPRSGTSLVEQILASHPDVFGAGELKYIQNYSFELNNLGISSKQFPYCMNDVPQSELERLSKDYLCHLTRLSGGKKKVTDKMPLNYQNLGLIYQLFPNAKIINCVRDPMDTCLSCYSQFFSGAHLYAYDLNNLGIVYRAYEKLMRFWKKVLPITILDVNYEELVCNQKDVTKQILKHCDLSWAEECMDFHKTNRPVATASVEQVRQTMYTGSIGKWLNYKNYLGALEKSLEENK